MVLFPKPALFVSFAFSKLLLSSWATSLMLSRNKEPPLKQIGLGEGWQYNGDLLEPVLSKVSKVSLLIVALFGLGAFIVIAINRFGTHTQKIQF